MAGRSGMGQNSIVRLLAYIHKIQIYSLNVSKDYTLKSFINDLKEVFNK